MQTSQMLRILMVYDSNVFLTDNQAQPLAGTQASFIELAKAFHKQGCAVQVLTATDRVHVEPHFYWGPIHTTLDDTNFDLMLVNVSPSLFQRFSFIKAKRRVLWVHNEAKYLFYWSRYKYLLRYWPTIVFSGNYHQSTYPFFIPSGPKKIIPLGLSEAVFETALPSAEHTTKKVFFTSNPLRSLRWLVDVWVQYIHPQVPDAELHVFSSWKTYGNWGKKQQERMSSETDYAATYAQHNVYVREALPKKQLFREMAEGRAMFYPGDRAETFCLAVAEAQALGLPAVVCRLGSMAERVQNGVTGYVVPMEAQAFAAKAIELLTNNDVWQQMRSRSREKYKNASWHQAAIQFLQLISKS
jgi:glycosyltransferase involved in cell wall biosynthesis